MKTSHPRSGDLVTDRKILSLSGRDDRRLFQCFHGNPIQSIRSYFCHMSGPSVQHHCRLYGIRNCDTMKKAFSWMESHGIDYEFIDYKKTGVVAARLPDWCRMVGWESLLNRRGLTWRRLAEAEREALDEASACALMTRHPTLIRRPVLEWGETLLMGFDADRYREVLG